MLTELSNCIAYIRWLLFSLCSGNRFKQLYSIYKMLHFSLCSVNRIKHLYSIYNVLKVQRCYVSMRNNAATVTITFSAYGAGKHWACSCRSSYLKSCQRRTAYLLVILLRSEELQLMFQFSVLSVNHTPSLPRVILIAKMLLITRLPMITTNQ